MTMHQRPHAVKAAASHLLASAGFRTKADGDPLEMLARKFGDHATEVMTKLGASNTELEGLKANMDELQQKMARRGGGEPAEPETIGKQFTDNPELKTFAEKQGSPGRFGMQIKTTITTATGSGGGLLDPARDPLLTLPKRRLSIRDLLPVVNVTTGSVEYPRLTARPTAADVVAETVAKPESAIAFDLVTTPMRVIAHWIPASRQILDDAPQLRGIIDSELMYGLKLKEEQQLLYGSGTGQNLTGMVTQATAYAAPSGITATTMPDIVAAGILQTALTDLEPDGVIIHPADWTRMRLMKDSQGNYILGKPNEAVAQVLFGLPVVTTAAMVVDKFLVGAFQAAGTIYDRWQARVEVSTEHADFFVRNMVAILCEERIGLAVKQPLALTYGDFGNIP